LSTTNKRLLLAANRRIVNGLGPASSRPLR